MYYEEQIINGILHYRLSPKDGYTQVRIESLSERVVKAEKKVNELRMLIEKLQLVVS